MANQEQVFIPMVPSEKEQKSERLRKALKLYMTIFFWSVTIIVMILSLNEIRASLERINVTIYHGQKNIREQIQTFDQNQAAGLDYMSAKLELNNKQQKEAVDKFDKIRIQLMNLRNETDDHSKAKNAILSGIKREAANLSYLIMLRGGMVAKTTTKTPEKMAEDYKNNLLSIGVTIHNK